MSEDPRQGINVLLLLLEVRFYSEGISSWRNKVIKDEMFLCSKPLFCIP